MKKFMTLFALAALVLVGCGDGDDDGTGNGTTHQTNGGGDTSDVTVMPRRIAVINYSQAGGQTSEMYRFEYDKDGNVTAYNIADRKYTNISITGTSFSYTEKYDSGDPETVNSVDEGITIQNGRITRYEDSYTEDGIAWDDVTTITYDANGRMTKMEMTSHKDQTLSDTATGNVTWSGGNITKTAYNFSDESENWSEEFTYGSVANNLNINLWRLFTSGDDPESLFLMGSRCAKLPTTHIEKDSHGTYTRRYDYVVDEAGYLTKVTYTDPYDNTTVYTITYED